MGNSQAKKCSSQSSFHMCHSLASMGSRRKLNRWQLATSWQNMCSMGG